MKKKKSFLSLGLFALVLVLGVGYAVVNSVGLDISGAAEVSDRDLRVSFNGETSVSNKDKVSASATDGELSATISVEKLAEVNESVTATYTIKNEETDVNASIIKSSIENNKSDFFEVTTDVDDAAKTVTAGDTNTVVVTVKLIKTPVSEADSTATIKINLTATPVQQ